MADELFSQIDAYLAAEQDDREDDLWSMLSEIAFKEGEYVMPVFDSFDKGNERFSVAAPFHYARLSSQAPPSFVWQPGLYAALGTHDAQIIGDLFTSKIDGEWLSVQDVKSLGTAAIRYGSWVSSLLSRELGPPGVARNIDFFPGATTLRVTFSKDGNDVQCEFDLDRAARPSVEDAVKDILAKLEEAFGPAETWQ